MKVVGFVGSPRIKGNTTSIVNEVLRGASEAGAETKIFNLNELGIRGCQACYKCQTPEGKCVQTDGMAPLYDEIFSADAVVIGTPVFGGSSTDLAPRCSRSLGSGCSRAGGRAVT